MNLRWHPKAEENLWRPDVQKVKRSEGGMQDLRYKAAWKQQWLTRFRNLLATKLPYCGVRYAF